MSDNRTDIVREFHKAMGHPAPDAPTLLSGAGYNVNLSYGDELCVKALEMRSAVVHFPRTSGRLLLRASMILEELSELLRAKTIVDQADALVDIEYLTHGSFVEMGIDEGSLFDIVHDANMSKIWPDGTAHLDPSGKVDKPPGWEAPEPKLRAELMRKYPEL